MFPFIKLGHQKDSSIFNWREKQTCFLNETFSDDSNEKLYFMEKKRRLFIECKLFWRCNSSKDRSWSSIFIEAKKCLFLAKARRISLEALFSLKRKIRLFREWHPFCHAKIRSINFKALFSLKRKRVRFLN